MSKRTCSVEGCERTYRCSGYCGLHYDRVRKNGHPDLVERPQKVCAVDDCGRKVEAQSYCGAHYSRLLESGDVKAHIPIKVMPTREERDDIVGRILSRTIVTDRGCIEWQGYCIPSGYGTISWNSRTWVVHRAMWTAQVGPIPTDDDWTIDHLCFNRRCVNVKHLEVVTRIENSRRGGGLPRAHAANKIRWIDECRNGHPRTEENTRIYDGVKCCLDCRKASWARRAPEAAAIRRAEYAERRAQGMSWVDARRSLSR